MIHFFTELEIDAQPNDGSKNFGPIDGNKFRLTSLHSASNNPKAFAICPGYLMYQKDSKKESCNP